MDSLKELVAAKDAGVEAIHALWTLHGLGQLDDATHQAGLLAKNHAVRRNATRALGADERATKLFFSAGVVSDPDPITKLAALVKLADLPTTKEIQTVVANLSRNASHQSDLWLTEATRLLVKRHHAQPFREGPNLLPNPSFEVTGADGLPEGWARRVYGSREGNKDARWEIVTGPGQLRSGKQALHHRPEHR